MNNQSGNPFGLPAYDQGGEMSATQVTDDQLHELNADEKSGMLFYLTGFLSKSPDFQDALTRAYDTQMRSRASLGKVNK